MSMKDKKLFGTDGIRGRVNVWPMTPDVVLRVGQALGLLVRSQNVYRGPTHRVVIGKDTRLSGYMIEMALSSGLNAMGVHVHLLGPMPTPGIGFLTQNMRADAGVVISASHNPFSDNGIKIFRADGFKATQEWEKKIEHMTREYDFPDLAEGAEVGRTHRIEDAGGRYIENVKAQFPHHETLEGLKIVLDCAHGAAYRVGPQILHELGAELVVLGDAPNGLNINENRGALHPQVLQAAVKDHKAHIGIALDGDGDRVMMVDEQGRLLNGDHILSICVRHAKEQGELPQNTVVVTPMSNFGLLQFFQKKVFRWLQQKWEIDML